MLDLQLETKFPSWWKKFGAQSSSILTKCLQYCNNHMVEISGLIRVYIQYQTVIPSYLNFYPSSCVSWVHFDVDEPPPKQQGKRQLNRPRVFGSSRGWLSVLPRLVQLIFSTDQNRLFLSYRTSWWLNQPIWKICSSNWIISPSRGENNKIFELPPPRESMVAQKHRMEFGSLKLDIPWPSKPLKKAGFAIKPRFCCGNPGFWENMGFRCCFFPTNFCSDLCKNQIWCM